MRRFNQSLAFCLLGLLGVVHSGVPAFVAEAWSHTAMYQEYQTIMSRSDALRLVIRGDLGCGFFTELEAFADAADQITLAWFEFSQPILPVPRSHPGSLAVPPGSDPARLDDLVIASRLEEDIEPPPPKAAA